MRTRMIPFITALTVVFLLVACKPGSTMAQRYYEDHLKTVSAMDIQLIQLDVSFTVAAVESTETTYQYVDRESGFTCFSDEPNDPDATTDYTVACEALLGMYDGALQGYVPFATSSGYYPVHPLHVDPNYLEYIVVLMDEDDIVMTSSDATQFRIQPDVIDLTVPLQRLVASGHDASNAEVPVIISATYNEASAMYETVVIDTSDLMNYLSTTLDWGLFFSDYVITLRYQQYDEPISFFIPTDNLVADIDVNYFVDGEYFGYRLIRPGDRLSGAVDYEADQDIVRMDVPISGYYELDHVSSAPEGPVLYRLYDADGNFVHEGIVGDLQTGLDSLFLFPGDYYLILFTNEGEIDYQLTYKRLASE